MFSNIFSQNRAFYVKMRDNIFEPDRPQMTIWRMRIACWIHKATDTHSQYIILTIFFPPHYNNGCTNVPQYYTIRIFPVSLYIGHDNELHLTATVFPCFLITHPTFIIFTVISNASAVQSVVRFRT